METSHPVIPVIEGIDISPDGVSISYLRLPLDIRKNGLAWRHQVFVPAGSDYDDELEALNDAALALLADVLDDEDRAEPIEPQEEEDDDDDE